MKDGFVSELKRLLPCIIAAAVIYLLLPLISLGDGGEAFGERLLTTVFPISAYVICMAYGVWRGYDWYAVPLPPAFAAIAILIYFDVSADIANVLVYAVFALMGLVIGAVVGRKNRRRR